MGNWISLGRKRKLLNKSIKIVATCMYFFVLGALTWVGAILSANRDSITEAGPPDKCLETFIGARDDAFMTNTFEHRDCALF